jgi:class 3 adenylate cyclase
MTTSVKYVFLDVVAFSYQRSIEAQSDIIGRLNVIVRKSLATLNISADQTILLPTGDGICIAMVNIETMYDAHLRLSLAILEQIDIQNESTTDPQRRFHVRVGVNAAVDNLITDINGNLNVAGSGINFAERLLSMADGGQVLAGQTVYESIRHRERYMDAFRSYRAKVKHGVVLPVFQYIHPGHRGLNTDEPSQFVTRVPDPPLTRSTAYYMGHCVRYREVFLSGLHRPAGPYWAVILLWMLARDADEHADTTLAHPYRPRTWGAGRLSFDEQMAHYIDQDTWLCVELSDFIIRHHLQPYARHFEAGQGEWQFVFVTDEGREKLRREWPSVWRDMELEAMIEPEPDGP